MTTSAQTHPSLEELAAFLDGKLTGEERARVIQHLDECPDCYETFAGTARFLEEEESLGKQTQGGRVVPFPLGGGDRQSWRRWLPLAAAVILVAGLAGTGYVSLFAPPQMKVAELLEPLEGNGKVHIRSWDTNRGGDEMDSSQAIAVSFLIGAWIVDRQVAIGLRESDSAQELSRRIWLALDSQGMQEEAKPFREEREKALETPSQEKAFLEELRKTAREREASLEKDNTALQTDYLAFGKWAEAARIAAATQNARFFESRDNRRFPSYFLKEDRDDLSLSQYAEIRQNLETAAQVLGNNELDAAGFKKLEPSLDRLIDKYESLAEVNTGLLEEDQE